MPLPVGWHQREARVAQGCAHPLCAHDDGAALWLTPVCHPGVGVCVAVRGAPRGSPCGAVVLLRCWPCRALVVQVALTTPVIRTPTCRYGRALDVMDSAGNLTVRCRRCHAVQGAGAVAPYGPG